MQRVLELGVNDQWGNFSKAIPGRVVYQCSSYWRQLMKDGWVEDPNYSKKKDGKFQFKRAKKGSIPDSLRKYSFTVLHDPSSVFAPVPGAHPKKPSDAQLTRYLSKGWRAQNSSKPAKGGKKAKAAKKGKATKESKKDGPPKKPQSAYFMFAASVREQIKAEFPKKKVTEIAKETGARWKAMSKEDKQPFNDRAAKAKAEHAVQMEAFLQKEDQEEAKANAEKDAEPAEVDTDVDAPKEPKREPKKKAKAKKSKKRKYDGAADPTEPDSKKRKVSSKDNGPMAILDGIVDLMTGERLVQPAISPYGHVMEYSSWCSILRQAKTKNKCPFTQQAMTRRSLVKLDADNVAEYQDRIVNVTAEQMKSFKS